MHMHIEEQIRLRPYNIPICMIFYSVSYDNIHIYQNIIGAYDVNSMTLKTRGSKEPVSLTLVYEHIRQRTQMDS